jgi:hypothetical protein
MWVGWPTVATIVGNKAFPSLADRYLARTGFDGQQTDEPVDPDRPDNLFAPVDDDRDFGAHGIFDARARRGSQVIPIRPKGYQILAMIGLAAAGLLLFARKS